MFHDGLAVFFVEIFKRWDDVVNEQTVQSISEELIEVDRFHKIFVEREKVHYEDTDEIGTGEGELMEFWWEDGVEVRLKNCPEHFVSSLRNDNGNERDDYSERIAMTNILIRGIKKETTYIGNTNNEKRNSKNLSFWEFHD